MSLTSEQAKRMADIALCNIARSALEEQARRRERGEAPQQKDVNTFAAVDTPEGRKWIEQERAA